MNLNKWAQKLDTLWFQRENENLSLPLWCMCVCVSKAMPFIPCFSGCVNKFAGMVAGTRGKEKPVQTCCCGRVSPCYSRDGVLPPTLTTHIVGLEKFVFDLQILSFEILSFVGRNGKRQKLANILEKRRKKNKSFKYPFSIFSRFLPQK